MQKFRQKFPWENLNNYNIILLSDHFDSLLAELYFDNTAKVINRKLYLDVLVLLRTFNTCNLINKPIEKQLPFKTIKNC
jgi:hypothetical protein